MGWAGEGVTAVFFLVIGLELKRELVEGELLDRRRLAAPALGALGGMLLPAALHGLVAYLALRVAGRLTADP